jgi:hypothetical protein
MSRTANEIIVADIVVDELSNAGYTVYKEVSISGGGSKRCDIYAVKDTEPNKGFTIVIEVKTTFNIKVIEQAFNWRSHAHMSYVAVPKSKNGRDDRYFARKICETFGVGVMEVNMTKEESEITVRADINKSPKPPTVYEEQKESVAGNSNNDFVTPFKITVQRIINFLKNQKSMPLLTVMRSIDHHYTNDKVAAVTIKKRIDLNVIPELRTYNYIRKYIF